MAYDQSVIDKVWENARATADQDLRLWRKDECGAWLYRDHYNSDESEYGWWIADTTPERENGVEGLRAFHRANSFDIENGAPKCTVTADRAGLAPDQQVLKPRNIEI